MNCSSVKKNLLFYLDGDLAPSVENALSIHINSCADCKKLLEFYQQTYTPEKAIKEPEFDPYFYTRLDNRIRTENNPKSSFSVFMMRKRILQPALWFSFVIIAMLIGLSFGRLANSARINKSALYADDYHYFNTVYEQPFEKNYITLISNE